MHHPPGGEEVSLTVKDAMESIQAILEKRNGIVTVKIHDGRIAQIDEMRTKRET
jgi:hypothetical protein